MRLLIHATFIFDDDDFRNIENYLQLKKGFSKEDTEYDNKLMGIFTITKSGGGGIAGCTYQRLCNMQRD